MLDADLLGRFASFLSPLAVDGDELALDALREVRPGGHFFGCAHTMARFSTAFHEPLMSDWRNFGIWTEAGSPDAACPTT